MSKKLKGRVEKNCKVKVKLTESVEEFNSFIEAHQGKFRLKPSCKAFDVAVDGELVISAKTKGDDHKNIDLALVKVSSALVKHTAAGLKKCGCRHCPFRGKDSSETGTRDTKDIEESFSGATVHMESIEAKQQKKRSGVSVYTKTGDGGISSLFNGDRVPKSSLVFDALGDVDELNTHVGLAYEHTFDLGGQDLCRQLKWIMCKLIRVGSRIATPKTSSSSKINKVVMDAGCVTQLERWIDEISEALPRISSFLLPVGGKACAALHVCRAVSRRAERSVVRLGRDEDDGAGNVVPMFMNRLSDYFFVAARLANDMEGRREVVYRRGLERRNVDDAVSSGFSVEDTMSKKMRRVVMSYALVFLFLLIGWFASQLSTPPASSTSRSGRAAGFF
eukprot:g2599.t1